MEPEPSGQESVCYTYVWIYWMVESRQRCVACCFIVYFGLFIQANRVVTPLIFAPCMEGRW
jgi:hypothetical protein